LLEDFQKEFDAYFPQRHLLSKAQPKLPESSTQSIYSFSSVPITAADELAELLDILQPNVTVSYEMLYERKFINATANLINTHLRGGSSGSDSFQYTVLFNYSLVTANYSTNFYFDVKMVGNTVKKTINITFPDPQSYRSYDDYFKYKFFPKSQSKHLEISFNNSFAKIWNTSHFQKTAISNCTTGSNLSARLNSTHFVQNYSYPCGNQEVIIEYKSSLLSELIFHPDEKNFNSTANITFAGYLNSIHAPVKISSQISGTDNSYKFANHQLLSDEGLLTECVRVNPKLIEIIMFDFALDFKHPKAKAAKFLQFLS